MESFLCRQFSPRNLSEEVGSSIRIILILAGCMQLLKEKKLLPVLPHMVDDVVMALEDSLKVQAAGVAARLRNAGRVVELIIEKGKKLRG